MLDFSGTSGRLKAIYDHITTYLSSLRMAKLDNVDVAVSTRAPASTALSSATWTGTKAGYLDAAITSRLGAIKAAYMGAVSIPSGQSSGTANLGGTVVPAKCVVLYLGMTGGMTAWNTQMGAYLTNLTSTSIQAQAAGDLSTAAVVGFMVVEFN